MKLNVKKHLPFSVILGKVVEEEERCLLRTESGDSGGIIKSWTAVKHFTNYKKKTQAQTTRHNDNDIHSQLF